MADFVAVIRRAVDGLSDNNPEMRSKVYEKARGAVRRQLEAMNPRPSDDLIKRQLDKLEAAIGSVESEHAEALPAEEATPEPVFEAVEPEPAEPEPVEAQAEEPQPVESEPEPVEPEPEPVAEEPQAWEEPRSVPEPEPYEEPVRYEEPPSYEEPEPYEEPARYEEPASHEEPAPYEEPVPVEAEHAAPEPAAEESAAEAYIEPEEPVAQAYAEESLPPEEAAPVEVEATAEPVWHAEPQPADDYVPSWQTDEEPVAAAPEPEAQASDRDHADEPAAAEASGPETDEHLYWQDPAPEPPPAEEQPQEAAARPVEDFSWDWPEEKPAPTEARQEMPSAGASEWGDLDDLLGAPQKAVPADEPASAAADAGLAEGAAAAAVAETAARGPQRSFRAEPRKSRRNLGAAVALVALLAVVGGAGAAYWFNRDKVDAWVGELVASATGPATTTTETADTTPADDAGADRSLPSASADGQQPAAGGTEVAAVATGQDSSGKFTQRLLADGTEVDEGPAPSLDAQAAEGKSVSPQSDETAALATEETPAVTDGAAGGTDVAQDGGTGAASSGTTDTQVPAADAGQAALGVAQKMFLYEERLGQTGPTAIEGTVMWSQAEESPGADARAEPVVRAQINVPASGLTALITFRRNADQSLPASHIIEIVFSLPATFEGGGIESVQRVAMKRTEQDRGDQLIAVPAKITDDFHMIALNDFPEAIAKNTELLRTREWIDIPITYRNGRRALITLDKGASGAEAFDTVMKAWGTQGSPNSQ
nr:hypothetical protein [Shinella pollutisoli]